MNVVYLDFEFYLTLNTSWAKNADPAAFSGEIFYFMNIMSMFEITFIQSTFQGGIPFLFEHFVVFSILTRAILFTETAS